MLKLTIPSGEVYDEINSKFIYSEEVTLVLEHSLVSLSKWETIWEKPFLGPEDKSAEETLSYIYCMILSPEEISPEVIQSLNNDQINQVNNYMNAKMSATWFNEKAGAGKRPSREIITAELIYHLMIEHKIPFECQNWHLNRLFTILKVRDAKSAPNKKNKMSQREMAAERQRINEERQAKYGTTG